MPSASELKKPAGELVRKGRALMLTGDREPAIAYLTAAVQANGSDATARRYLAHSLIAANLNEDAILQFGMLAKLQPLVDADSLLYARALVACKQMRQAVGVYTDLLASNPRNDTARTDLINALIDSGSADDAVRIAQEGMVHQPGLQAKYRALVEQAIALKSNKSQTM